MSVLKYKNGSTWEVIGALPHSKSGIDNPSSTTAAEYIGQFYVNLTTHEAFVCTAISESGTTWQSLYVSGKEDIGNKKTTITGNESSDVYYPTTKAVATYHNNNKDVFQATYDNTGYGEIQSAVSAGKIVVCLYNGFVCRLSNINTSDQCYTFTGATAGGSQQYLTCIWASGQTYWSHGDFTSESRGLKVNTVTGNESSESYYPTTKAIAEYHDSTKANKVTKVVSTMTAANWSNNTYSFEEAYPAATYNIEVELAPTATLVQYKAYGKAGLTGNTSSNVLTAINVVPTVDIPIIITVEVK